MFFFIFFNFIYYFLQQLVSEHLFILSKVHLVSNTLMTHIQHFLLEFNEKIKVAVSLFLLNQIALIV